MLNLVVHGIAYFMRWIMIMLFLFGCSGYRFTQQNNPLSQYGIQSLSVPMFYNYSNMPEVTGHFTRETYKLLAGYSGLKLSTGYSENTDAVLIGIIRSREKTSNSQRPMSLRVAKNQAPRAVGAERGKFYVPGSTDLGIVLQLIIIKKPNEEELALLRSDLGPHITSNSRLIFNEMLPLNSQYTREILDRPGTEVIATQNAGLQRRTVKSLAESAATSIRDTILYAF
jgi:hypothetical protein